MSRRHPRLRETHEGRSVLPCTAIVQFWIPAGFQPSVHAGEATILGAIAGWALAHRLAADEWRHPTYRQGSSNGRPEGIAGGVSPRGGADSKRRSSPVRECHCRPRARLPGLSIGGLLGKSLPPRCLTFTNLSRAPGRDGRKQAAPAGSTCGPCSGLVRFSNFGRRRGRDGVASISHGRAGNPRLYRS